MIRELLGAIFRDTVTYALVGESGTGKSYHSKFVAARYKIRYIIDDGLLIKDERVAAGRTAKEEQTMLAAVKAAVFSDKARRDEVARKLLADRPRRVLVLGTSEKMVDKIALRLQLPLPRRVIRIEEFAKPKDIDTALRTRRIEGKHIIPIPSVEARRSCPDIFLTGSPIFKGKIPTGLGIIPESYEKSIVRPAYSGKPRIRLNPGTLSVMVRNSAREFNPNIRVKEIEVTDRTIGYGLTMTIDVPFAFRLDKKIVDFKRFITDNVERYTAILIEEVNVMIDKNIEKV